MIILKVLLNTQMIFKMFVKILNNLGKNRKMLIAFDDMVADIINNNKLNPVITELFIRGRKLSISIAFITKLYFKVPKDVRVILQFLS